MISYLQSLAIGNAVRLGISPAPGASYYRVLRRADANFAGATDQNAYVVADLQTGAAVLDIDAVNGTTYFYADYSMVNGAWVAGSIGQIECAASYMPGGMDPQEFVRERVQLGLAVEVGAGRLVPDSGVIKVVTAPFVLQEGILFPVVSVHLELADSSNRYVGDSLVAPFLDTNGNWDESRGWLGRYTLAIVGVSLNPDERIALRKAIQRIMVGNMPLFAAAGFSEAAFSQVDQEQAIEKNAPLYMTAGTFNCLAPVMIVTVAPPIATITVNGISAEEPIFTETSP